MLRTPQTLTLVGVSMLSFVCAYNCFLMYISLIGYTNKNYIEKELEEEEDDEDDEEGLGDMDDTEEEVEILVSFEEEGREYHLVRLLDPVLLVGKIGNENTRILLTPEESDVVMPQLEKMFMSNQDGM